MKNLSEITTVILAGGLGARLCSVVSDRPKVLAKIGNRPFLTFLLDQLVIAKAKDVVLCTGYMANKIHKALGEQYRSLRLIHSREPEPLGTGGALRLAMPHINSDPVLIMNGDSFVNIDLTVYIDWFFKKNRKASLLLVNAPNTERYGKVIVAKDGLLSAFEEKVLNSGPGWINAGVYIMKKSLVESIPAGNSFSLEREFVPGLIGKGLYGFFANEKFIDIGTPESYRQAEKFFREKNFLPEITVPSVS